MSDLDLGTHTLTLFGAHVYERCVRLTSRFNLTLILATQLTGFGIAGLARRFLVWPASMVWPQNLVACTLLNTLHAEDDSQGGGTSRYKFFMITAVAAFFYYFLPGVSFSPFGQ